MRRSDWVWIFFVIIAVGLVLSWGRTGQRLQKEQTDAGGGLDVDRVLSPESPCRPLQSPCAAFGQTLAVVLGPVAASPGVLALKLVADETRAEPPRPRIDWQAEGEGYSPELHLAPRHVPEQDQWLVVLPEDSAQAPAPSLWVRLDVAETSYAAQFPLR